MYCQYMTSSFGENLKRERIAAGYTQKKLAERLGIAQQRISQWELGEVEPTLSSLIAIINELNIKFEDLVDLDKP